MAAADESPKRILPFNIHIPLLTGIAALLLVAASWWALQRIEQAHRDQVGAALVAIRDTAHVALRDWLREHRAGIRILASTPEVADLTQELLVMPETRAALLAAPAQEQLRALLAPTLRRRDYRGFFLLAPDGTTLSASRDIEVGGPGPIAGEAEILAQLRAGEIVVTHPLFYPVPLETAPFSQPVPAIFLATPVAREGRLLAFLVLRLDPWQEFASIFQRGRFGRTGEAFAFNGDGLLLTPSRFDVQLQRVGLLAPGQESMLRIYLRDPGVNLIAGEESPLPRDRQPLTRMAASAVRGENGVDLAGYRDYRGVPVAGAWAWAEEMNVGIAIESDVAEAHRELRTARFALLLLTGFALLLLLAIALLSIAARRRVEVSERMLRATNRELDAFVYTVSHDLRSLLTPVIGFAEFLRLHRRQQSAAEVDDLLEKIQTQGERALGLLEDLLLLARLGKPEVAHAVDSAEVVAEAVADLDDAIAARQAEVRSDRLPVVRLPKTLLLQVFGNLIGNAVHYAGAAGPIEVGGERHGKRIRFFVRDHGPGIPAAERERIFDVFYRGSTGAQVRGTGIGLAIVQKIAHLYGGRAWVEETPGGGATFRVEMNEED